jgi:hypothetical protein
VEFKDSPLEKHKDFWRYLEENYREVASWPVWMRGDSNFSIRKNEKESDSPGRCAKDRS